VTIQNQKLHLQVRVSNQNGSKIIEKESTFLPEEESDALLQFKIELLADGAKELIQT
jgi:porphobilinogen deaminase